MGRSSGPGGAEPPDGGAGPDPLELLDRLVTYLRDEAPAADLLAAARWASLLIQAVEIGAFRERLGWPARLFPELAAAGGRALSGWARDLERSPGGLIIPT
jgi:hypothetical protein